MTIPFLRASSHKVAARALCSETVLIFPLYYDAPADFSADIRVCVTCLMALWIVWVVELKINRGIFGKLLFFIPTFLSPAREKLQKSAAKDRTYGSPLDSNSLVTHAAP